MRATAGWFFGIAVLLGQAGAARSQDKIVADYWDAAYLEGTKAGYVHTLVRELTVDERKVLRTRVELNLSVQRGRDTAKLRVENGTDENPEGKVTGVFMRYFLAKNQELIVQGTVDGDTLHVKFKGAKGDREADKPWNDRVVGLYRQERLFREHKVKPGKSFDYLSYEPTVTAVVETKVTVKDYEDVVLPGSTRKQRLLRVEAAPNEIEGVKLPTQTLWLNEKLMMVYSQSDVPGLGKMALYRTSEAAAKSKSTASVVPPDIMQFIVLNRNIPDPFHTESVVYRITYQGKANPATLFAKDGRQEIRNVGDHAIEVRVHALKEPQPKDNPGNARPEFLKSCYFINSDDEKVKEGARQAVGTETDPWKKAKRIERWVFRYIVNKNYENAFDTADHVMQTREGDCTEHAVLAAALCRAAGVPSRAAVGLIYIDNPNPSMAFHMWTEVWVRGQWMPIDATRGSGYVGANYLKISDHSWYGVQSLTPLLPTLNVLSSKIKIEVVNVNNKDEG
jgi:transglutaminase-like putative cysteine protease